MSFRTAKLDPEARAILKKAAMKLETIQEKLDEINDEYEQKLLELEALYAARRKPVYSERTDLLSSLPGFWFAVFCHHESLCNMLHPNDKKVFQHVKRLDVDENEDGKGAFRITVTFEPNPFLADAVLWKEIGVDALGDRVITQSGVQWKTLEEFQTASGKKKYHSPASFFNFFEALKPQEEEKVEFVAHIIRDEIWPNPIEYFIDDEDDEDDEGTPGGSTGGSGGPVPRKASVASPTRMVGSPKLRGAGSPKLKPTQIALTPLRVSPDADAEHYFMPEKAQIKK